MEDSLWVEYPQEWIDSAARLLAETAGDHKADLKIAHALSRLWDEEMQEWAAELREEMVEVRASYVSRTWLAIGMHRYQLTILHGYAQIEEQPQAVKDELAAHVILLSERATSTGDFHQASNELAKIFHDITRNA